MITRPRAEAPALISFEIRFAESRRIAAAAQRQRLSTESPNTMPASSESVTAVRDDDSLSVTFFGRVRTESAGSPRRSSAYASDMLASTVEMRTFEPLSASSLRFSATPASGEYFTENSAAKRPSIARYTGLQPSSMSALTMLSSGTPTLWLTRSACVPSRILQPLTHAETPSLSSYTSPSTAGMRSSKPATPEANAFFSKPPDTLVSAPATNIACFSFTSFALMHFVTSAFITSASSITISSTHEKSRASA